MLTALGILLGTVCVCLVVPRRARSAPWICAAGCSLASGAALLAAWRGLTGGAQEGLAATLALPGASFSIGMDPLSSFFLLLISLIVPPTAVFGAGYLARHADAGGARSMSFFFCLLVASMMLVVVARNAVLFLVAWETMTLSSWVLVVSDHEQEGVRSAGRRYLVASQLGGACLLALFALLGGSGGGLDFGDLGTAAAGMSPAAVAAVLALALLGFGTKAGLFPLHVWLPLAHPAAPSHVSALMSGVMIKMGFYGLLRVQLLLGGTPVPFAVALIVVGAMTAIYGIATALGQRDLKRALACSSIENMGIVAVGLGIAGLGAGLGSPGIAVLAASGALLHLASHMLTKGLLFLGAGAVVSGAHTRDLEKLGGLLGRLPWTGAAWIAGAAGLSALPPFAGVVGEWLLLVACFEAAMAFPVDATVLVILAGLSLVVSGGLAAASFARLAGIAFLGQPRSEAAARATEGGASMVAPVVLLAAATLALGLWPHAAAGLLWPAISQVAGTRGALTAIDGVVAPLEGVARIVALLLCAVAVALAGRAALPGLRRRRGPGTWGCGYSLPTSRLEYTASSFSRPLVRIFGSVVKPHVAETRPEGFFPRLVRSETSAPDRVEKGFFEPLFAWTARKLSAVRRFQHGHLSKYVLQIVGTLVAGLVWAVASRWVGRS